MLEMTGVKLEELLDIDMYLFVEKGLRGGISYIAKRYAKVNNKSWKIMILQNRQNTYRTVIWITCIAEQWIDIFLMVDLSG